MKTALIALIAMVVTGLPLREARAQAKIDVFLSAKAPDPNSKNKDDAPTIEATVVGGPTVPINQFTLTDPSAKPPVVVKASALRPYSEGSETIAVAFVFYGQEIWIGNDDKEPEESSSRYPGILKSLKAGLQEVPIATAGPSGSKGVLISYSDKAVTKVPMGPLANITPEALGTQDDYYRKAMGSAMVEGLSLAITELHNVTASRKALIIVCDGNDSNADAAKGALAALKKQATQEQIQTFAIVYKGALSEARNDIVAMIPGMKVVQGAEGIVSELKSILSRMADRYYLTFPGYDPKTKTGLKWDGKPHELALKIDKLEPDPVEITLAPVWNPPTAGFPWWILIVGVIGLLLVIIIAAKVFGKKEEAPMPMPMPMPMAAPAPAEAPKPAGPAKTVMIGVGGDDGFPIVGWLVPLNGQNAYQTFRLRSGGTKIGTAPPSDIVVNDGFMSTDHCQINCSPQGFTLVDGGSTNGCYVNDRKVAKHELVDNDMITLGKTNFKFKSIN